MFIYSDVFIKLVVGFLFMTVLINFSGKGNLAPTSAIDQVQNYVLGGIVGGVIYNSAVTLLQFVLVLLIWSLLILVTRYLKIHIRVIGKFIDGGPITIVRNGKLLVHNCLKANLSAKEIDFKLRTAGVYQLDDVKRAIVEQNGSLTVLRQGDGSIRYPIIVDGQIDQDVLELMDHDEDWLLAQLAQHGIKNIRDVYMAKYKNHQFEITRYDED
ncbi:DUF421 domain-containing protein [Levilactobacillus tujiorum]|uniref:DUF421 domain-containing protein n=1 Tax=Levilactobacillus tujiorum TaxID=2912243 RepID=A0ABX1L6V4_9LACO|nr:DUF421 domain-containing protein [Levilactobacillus tujiorum]MCH5465777.1 DUF421 domain-containing protein [Levilactobacillus tujiorum]NLR12991.1 DUF421 domain-containing protein [Lactobacillus sp. HBUAS51387]NLR30811.1 DUF421 domain-containing protein [Levilactobacillus tujiorum]